MTTESLQMSLECTGAQCNQSHVVSLLHLTSLSISESSLLQKPSKVLGKILAVLCSWILQNCSGAGGSSSDGTDVTVRELPKLGYCSRTAWAKSRAYWSVRPGNTIRLLGKFWSSLALQFSSAQCSSVPKILEMKYRYQSLISMLSLGLTEF